MEIRTIFIAGAGLMGSGIAQTAIMNGFEAILFDKSEASLERGRNGIEMQLDRLVAKGKMTQEARDNALANLTVSSNMQVAAKAQLAIEAIYEDETAKGNLLKALDEICDPETIFASNTSSISLTALGSVTKRPDKVVGMHFFSPVPMMRLLEIVSGLNTSGETIRIADEIGRKMGKWIILSKDKPGFIVNRALLPMLNEAVQILDEGIGSVEDVDFGLKYGCNHPMGPLELADMIGLDILLEVMQVFYEDLGDTKYRPAHLLRKMVTANYLGKKTGNGFYSYENGRKSGINPALARERKIFDLSLEISSNNKVTFGG